MFLKVGFYKRRLLVVPILLIAIIIFLFRSRSHTTDSIDQLIALKDDSNIGFPGNEVFITVVACGERLVETLIMIKSALMFNDKDTFIIFHVITQNNLKEEFNFHLHQWQDILPGRFSFHLHSLKFPKTKEEAWRSLFKPCAAQRLFLPSLLHNIDATIYVDTDVLFLSSASDLWSHFDRLNDTQIAGLSPEHEDPSIGWYNRFARHPFFGKLGVNSGVMLMNLTRMRQTDWEQQILPIYRDYRSKITWGDQDLINILFYFHPDKLYIFPCIYNYRPDHCMYINVCDVEKGIRIIHGNRRYFHSPKQPLFKEIYNFIKGFQISANISKASVASELRSAVDTPLVRSSTCGKIINDLG